MKTPEITLEVQSDTHVVALWTGADGCRFHVWINRPKGVWTIGDVIYKNPPAGAQYRKPSSGCYFETRKLDLTAKANAAVAARIAELATPDKLDALAATYAEAVASKQAAELRAATVKHLAECVTAIRGATHEELAEALASASDQVAAAAEVLRCS